MDKKELQEELTKRGIEFDGRAGVKKLKELLAVDGNEPAVEPVKKEEKKPALAERWMPGDPLPVINGYHLMNEIKVDRAINGTPDPHGIPKGGVAQADGRWDPQKALVEYDRLGGYITNKNGDKVVTGSFYDFRAKRAKDVLNVEVEHRINNKRIVIKENEPEPTIVRASRELKDEENKS